MTLPLISNTHTHTHTTVDVQVLAERHGGTTGGSDAFGWELQRLQQYSKTQPVAAIIARSPGKAVLVRFDEQGSALLFDPCYDLDGSRLPTFFAFPNQGEGLQQHLAETFPFHDEYATTQHWHHAHFNEYVCTPHLDDNGIKRYTELVLRWNETVQTGMGT